MTHLTNLETTLIETLIRLIRADILNELEYYNSETIVWKIFKKYPCVEDIFISGTGKTAIVKFKNTKAESTIKL